MTTTPRIETPYSRYEPIFGSWYITGELGGGSSGHLYRIWRVDDFGNEFSAVLKAISIPAGGEAEIRSVLASGVEEKDLESYYEGIIGSVSNEFTILSKLSGNTHIVDYSDHEIIRHEDAFGWDILIRMELLTPLQEYAKTHDMTPEDVLDMGCDLCSALALCGKNHIIHRDIKPENIFVTDTGDYKLGDFGIARIDAKTHSSFSRKGTFPYMAPEVFRNEDYSQSVDVYSLGLVLYQYLNHGRLPFLPPYPDPIVYEDTEKAFAERITGHEIPPPREGSRDLQAIVAKACAYHKEDRYQSAEEMLSDLETLKHEGKLKQLPATGLAAARLAKARRRKLAAGALTALLILGGIGYAAMPKHVSSIEGIEQNTELLLDETLAPEYEVGPSRFKDEKISFTSSDESVFTVDENGKITAVGVGKAVLTLQAETYTREIQITVDPKVTAISGIEEEYALDQGETLALKPKLTPKKYAKEPVVYKSSDPEVFTVSEDGVLTAVAPGSGELTVSAGGFTLTAEVDVMAAVDDTVVQNNWTYTPAVTAPAAPEQTTTETPETSPSGPPASTGTEEAADGVFDESEDEYF